MSPLSSVVMTSPPPRRSKCLATNDRLFVLNVSNMSDSFLFPSFLFVTSKIRREEKINSLNGFMLPRSSCCWSCWSFSPFAFSSFSPPPQLKMRHIKTGASKSSKWFKCQIYANQSVLNWCIYCSFYCQTHFIKDSMFMLILLTVFALAEWWLWPIYAAVMGTSLGALFPDTHVKSIVTSEEHKSIKHLFLGPLGKRGSTSERKQIQRTFVTWCWNSLQEKTALLFPLLFPVILPVIHLRLYIFFAVF